MPEKTAVSVVLFSPYGSPERFISDQGREFVKVVSGIPVKI